MKKIILILTTFFILFSCNKNEVKKIEESKEISVFAIFQGKVFDSDFPVFKEAEKITGVKLVGVASKNQRDEVQAFNLMLSGGEFPDVIAYESTAELEKLGIDGVLIPLEDLIEKYAPNIKKFWEENPQYKKDAVAVDGHIYMIPNYNDVENVNITQQYYIRKDWLRKLNLEEPKTVEELYDTLVAFRDRDPNENGEKDEIPIFLKGHTTRKILMGLADIFKAQVVWYDKNGIPTFGPTTPEWKNAMINLSKWYREGLIDPEIFVRGADSRNYMLRKNIGGFTSDWASAGIYTESLSKLISEFDFSVILPPEYRGNNKTFFGRPNYMGAWGITKNAKDVVTIIKYFDFWYSEEGRRLWNFGIEGIDYLLVDGKPKFTDKILKNPTEKNPVAAIRREGAQYRLGMFQDAEAERQALGEVATKAMNLYTENDVVVLPMPQLKYTQEELEEFVRIETILRLFTEEMAQKWILGVSDVESDWEEYIEKLNSLGLKKATEIQKKAYNRFINN